MDAITIHRVSKLDLRVEPWDWPFARERASEIAAHFAEKKAAKPKLYNGRILLIRRMQIAGDKLAASYFETDFASFLFWRDRGFPDRSVTNGFGMGALRGSDGVFLMGEMSDDTANAGRIYFPSGTPDPNDISGDRVDIPGSIIREMAEETGLTAADYEAALAFYCVSAPPLLAIIQVLTMRVPAHAGKDIVLANIAKQRVPEFTAVHLVRDARDLKEAMPRFVAAFVREVAAAI